MAYKHGYASKKRARNRTYTSWAQMIDRCTNPKNSGFVWYSARGISMCERWKKFENFLADMGRRPKGKTLDRWPNNDGNYEPGNCRWATPSQQARNRRITPAVVEHLCQIGIKGRESRWRGVHAKKP